ncbi:MAG: hypothetical protein ACRCYQ_11285 [Nocardioides sp.]
MTLIPAELDFDLDDLPFLVGPTEARPFARWLPDAVALMTQVFAAEGADPATAEPYLTEVLTRIGQADDSPLPYRLIRWLTPDELPVVATFGLVERGTEQDLDGYLAAVDAAPVEAPVVETLVADPRRTVRRSFSYSSLAGNAPGDQGLVVELRYVVDDAHPELVALIHAADRSPGALVKTRDALDEVAGRMRIRPSPGAPGRSGTAED